MYDMSSHEHTENDVLILGSDGLWDVTTNERAAAIVQRALQQFSPEEKARCVNECLQLLLL